MSLAEKRATIDPNNKDLSIAKQCELLGLARSSYYYNPKPYSDYDLFLMKIIDRIHTAQPTYGSRRIKVEVNLTLKNHKMKLVNRKRIQTLMHLMEIQTIYQKPNLSKLLNKEYIYPYLLKNVEISRVNQVWASDITYIPFNNGFIYLYAIIDWYSRTILNWNISTSLQNDFVINTIKETFEKYGKPEIMNSDQGGHFTSKEYTELLKSNEVKISMDGKARALDNIIIERFWRTIKYDYLFLNDFVNQYELEKGIYNWIHYYNNFRPHQALDYNFPMNVYNVNLYKTNIIDKNIFDPKYEEYNLYKDLNKIIKVYQKQS